eukprot:s301_g14.t1
MQWSAGKAFLSSIALQAVLDILWGRKALVVEEGGDLYQLKGKLDDADSLYSRCLMRKWEMEAEEPTVCFQAWRSSDRLPCGVSSTWRKTSKLAALSEACPSDVEAVRALQLDCLEPSDGRRCEVAIGRGENIAPVHPWVARRLRASAIVCAIDGNVFWR